jgi:mono/diheme cytochrome c family protein
VIRPLACALVLCTAARAQTVTVRGGGREAAVELSALPRRTAEVSDRTDGGRRKQLSGVPLRTVLERLPAPPGADALAVRCDDGWFALIPLAAIARSEGLLAVDQGGAPLAPPRGPVFLTWPNVATPSVDADRALNPNGWAWGVAALEYVRAGDLHLAAPAGAPVAAAAGAALFEQHCQHCHAIAGAGGMAGWDLARPPLLSYRDPRRVRRYLVDPRRLNPSGRMPSFKGKLAPTELDALLAYLAALGR